MNEWLFISQLCSILLFLIAALRLGKETLITAVVLQALMANLFVIKQIDLFGFTVTPSDAFAVGTIFSLNLLQEFYGKASAKKAIGISFFAMLFFSLLSQLHLCFKPTLNDSSQSAYQTILAHTPRLFIASLGALFTTQLLDIRFFSLLQKLFKGKKLPLRTALSLTISQLTDTLLFTFFGLYGIAESLTDIIIVSFTIKFIAVSLFTAYATLIKRESIYETV